MGYFDYAGGRFREDDLITVTDEVDVAYEQARLAWRPLPAAVVCAIDLRETVPSLLLCAWLWLWLVV